MDRGDEPGPRDDAQGVEVIRGVGRDEPGELPLPTHRLGRPERLERDGTGRGQLLDPIEVVGARAAVEPEVDVRLGRDDPMPTLQDRGVGDRRCRDRHLEDRGDATGGGRRGRGAEVLAGVDGRVARMGVRVDDPGQDQRAVEVDRLARGRFALAGPDDGDDPPAIDRERSRRLAVRRRQPAAGEHELDLHPASARDGIGEELVQQRARGEQGTLQSEPSEQPVERFDRDWRERGRRLPHGRMGDGSAHRVHVLADGEVDERLVLEADEGREAVEQLRRPARHPRRTSDGRWPRAPPGKPKPVMVPSAPAASSSSSIPAPSPPTIDRPGPSSRSRRTFGGDGSSSSLTIPARGASSASLAMNSADIGTPELAGWSWTTTGMPIASVTVR